MPRYVQSRPSAHTAKLLRAIRAGDGQAFERTLDTEGPPSSRNAADFKLLKKALMHGRPRMARTLLDRGCQAYGKVNGGNSPLHLAASRPYCAGLVRRLLDHGARVDQRNRKQETPLHVAFAFADGKAVDLMLKHHLRKSSANERNRIGLTYLHIAAARSKLNNVRHLLGIDNADVNCKVDVKSESPYAGFTPLHMAVEYGRRNVAKMLLSCGADLWARDFQGSTPLHLALELRNVEMIELLLAYDYKMEDYVNDLGLSHFMATCVARDSSIAADYLLHPFNSKMAMINERVDKYDDRLSYPFKNYTPLHFAAMFGRQETVRLLLANGARCRSRNDARPMPVDLATMNSLQRAADLFVMECLRHNWSPAITSYDYKAVEPEGVVARVVGMNVDDNDSGYSEADEIYSDSADEYWEDNIQNYIL